MKRNEISIKVGNVDDGESIKIFANELSEDPNRSKEKWLNAIKQNDVYPLLAIANGKIVGKIQALIIENYGWLESARVLPSTQGKGIANMLIEESIEWLHQKGVRYIRSSVDSDNLPARIILERKQFNGHFIMINPNSDLVDLDDTNGYSQNFARVLDPELFDDFVPMFQNLVIGNMMVDDRYIPVDKTQFAELIEQERIFSDNDKRTLIITSEHKIPEEYTAFVISNSEKGYKMAGDAVRSFAAQELAGSAIVHAPAKRDAIEGLIKAKFGWNSPHSLIVYQLDLNKSNGSSL